MTQSSPRVYARRKPEQDPLHQVLSQHLLTFLEKSEADEGGAGLPAFVKKELFAYLDCGLLCKGAVRVHCAACDHSLVVALSCRGRGICPSCGGRRMNDTAAHLVDRVVPDVSVRQYVLSLPPKYRFVIARDPARMQAVVGLFVREVFRWLRRAARARGIKDGRPGSVSSVQRFGDGLVYNCHVHALFLQGVYHRPKQEEPPVFLELPPPTQDEVAALAIAVKKKVEKLLRKQGVLPEEEAEGQAAETLWERLCAASVAGRIAQGPKAGWRVRRLGAEPVLLPPGERHLVADADGFNVHAHTHVRAEKREELERLCRYILRPALSGKRLSLTQKGDVLFALKRAWSDGTTHLLFAPMELIEKLAVLIPPPRRHLVGYFGVLSSAAAWRKELIPRPEQEKGQPAPEDPPPLRPRRLGFAALLLRTFGIEILVCPRCEGKMKVVAVVMEPGEVERLCKGLGEPTSAPPVHPSRYRRQMQLEFAEPP